MTHCQGIRSHWTFPLSQASKRESPLLTRGWFSSNAHFPSPHFTSARKSWCGSAGYEAPRKRIGLRISSLDRSSSKKEHGRIVVSIMYSTYENISEASRIMSPAAEAQSAKTRRRPAVICPRDCQAIWLSMNLGKYARNVCFLSHPVQERDPSYSFANVTV